MKNVQYPMGIEPMTPKFSGWQAGSPTAVLRPLHLQLELIG